MVMNITAVQARQIAKMILETAKIAEGLTAPAPGPRVLVRMTFDVRKRGMVTLTTEPAEESAGTVAQNEQCAARGK